MPPYRIIQLCKAQPRTVPQHPIFMQARYLEACMFQRGTMTVKCCWRLSARLERTSLLSYQH